MAKPQPTPITNCHTHIFTANHVPPFLTRSFVPLIYWMFPLHPILKGYKRYLKWRSKYVYNPKSLYNRVRSSLHELRKSKFFSAIIGLIGAWLIANAIHVIFINWLKLSIPIPDWLNWLAVAWDFLLSVGYKIGFLVKNLPSRVWEIVIVSIVILFFKSGRNLIFFLLKNFVSFFKRLPGKNTTSLIKRYILIGKYTMYEAQSGVYGRLKRQYPPGTKFVVLPMDMKYMKAGKIRKEGGYYAQLQRINEIKVKETSNGTKQSLIKPFVFVDPRRIRDHKLNDYINSPKRQSDIALWKKKIDLAESKIERVIKDQPDAVRKRRRLKYKLRMKKLILDDLQEMKPLFQYTIRTNPNTQRKEVVLDKDTLIKQYIEDNEFNGFKIYPALGYYPFDEDLLALWKYAADHAIPIMTHCISGTIFYRGSKKKEWFEHPIFMEPDGNEGNRPLKLPQRANIDFTVNFGHPLNYLCLLDEQLLRKVLSHYNNKSLNDLFGFKDLETPLEQDLSNLKICLAHFGGEPEWEKYLEADRSLDAQNLIQKRSRGLRFIQGNLNVQQWNRLSRYWKYTDWYSIICSLMIQYPNVYADISYILSKPRILPLLKETLDPKLNVDELRKKVLYGTDFYVVRNHFSEKDLLAQMRAGLSQSEFDLIARDNPQTFI